LKNDPWEEHNLATDSKYQDQISKFMNQCDETIGRLLAARYKN